MSVAASIVERFADNEIKLDVRRELMQLISEALTAERACNARTARVIGKQFERDRAKPLPMELAEQIAKSIEIPRTPMLSKQQRQDIEDLSAKGWTPMRIAFDLDLDVIDVEDEIDRQCQDTMDGLHGIGDDDHAP